MKSREAKPVVPPLGCEQQVAFSNLSNEDLLTRLANSPCATRSIPAGQSLEEYLLKVQSAVEVDSSERSGKAVAQALNILPLKADGIQIP